MRAVVIHGVEIPEALIAREAQNHPGRTIGEARAAAGHALATKALLLHRARELGLVARPERDEDGREETEEAALVGAVLDAEIEITPPTRMECRRVFEAQRARFRTPLLYEASHILIEPASADEADVRAAHAIARRLTEHLLIAPGDFAACARQHSACPSREVGGSLGQLRKGDLVAEVENVLLALEPGQIAAEPARSRFGWHVLRLARRTEARDLPFALVEDRIRLHLESRAWTAAAARYVSGLAEQAHGKGIALSLDVGGSVNSGSACLGDLIGDGSLAERLVSWLDEADPDTASRLRDAAVQTGSSATGYVRAVVADFVARATDEHWTRLISAARDAHDPSQAALAAIMKADLAAQCAEPDGEPALPANGRRRDFIGGGA